MRYFSITLGNSIFGEFEMEGLVCPLLLRSNFFCIYAAGSVDHDPISTISRSEDCLLKVFMKVTVF